MVEQKKKWYALEVGMQSLVGVGGPRFNLKTGEIIPWPDDYDPYPYSSANYMSIRGGPYIVNMWAENLREFARRNPNKLTIEITEFTDGWRTLGVVTDPEIPQNWLNNKLCITGSGWGSREICEAIHSFLQKPIKEGWICGCELPNQEPSISTMYPSDGSWKEYRCWNCNRVWRITKENEDANS